MRYTNEDFREKNIAEVKCIDERGGIWAFFLTPMEIKHIRRCLYNRDLIHPPAFEGEEVNSLTHQLMDKFKKFGELTPAPIKSLSKPSKREGKKCEYKDSEGKETCNETKVEIHHRVKRANGGTGDLDNCVFLCAHHHDLIEIEAILARKLLEVEKTKGRIEKIKEEIRKKSIS